MLPGLRLAAALAAAAGDAGEPPPDVEFTLFSVAGAVLLASVAAIPLGISLWALLDVARRPRWAWALAGRSQVLWMVFVLFGLLSIVGGLLISSWYLVRVRPVIAATEAGEI